VIIISIKTKILNFLKLIEYNIGITNTDINKRVMSALSDTPQSTYKIAKLCDIGWSTALTYLLRLKQIKELNIKNKKIVTRHKETMIWWI